ncbi:hypothetical protein IU510_21150 [Nocardia cyriacigeorgica]|uniref:hypothetical protein n=1 Tax=Nocardia TaxID=1817 RepID=UPI0018949F27|nr:MULTISPECIES: hypothetical protein [Nocardia]MBF6100569.1 hypothetical protein [Nocardia cyriacigeorgica]
MRPDTPIDTGHGADWLHPEPTAPQPVPSAPTEVRCQRGDHWQWLDDEPAAHVPPAVDNRLRARGHRTMWIALAATLIVAAAVTGAGIRAVIDVPETAAVIPTLTAAPVATAELGEACTGLTGTSVTDVAGDTRSLPGVIAAFEHAYYRHRDAAAALGLVAPEAGLTTDALAAGIASIPAGTTHCVAITPIAENAAEVHLAELHPDGSRVDYLQLINTRTTAHGEVLITNIQKRG